MSQERQRIRDASKEEPQFIILVRDVCIDVFSTGNPC